MSKILDFTKLNKPTMQVVLRGNPPVALEVLPPTTKQMELLVQISNKLSDHPEKHRDELYEFAALLLSQNREGRTFTGEQLEREHAMKPDDLTLFYVGYADFIAEVSQAKN